MDKTNGNNDLEGNLIWLIDIVLAIFFLILGWWYATVRIEIPDKEIQLKDLTLKLGYIHKDIDSTYTRIVHNTIIKVDQDKRIVQMEKEILELEEQISNLQRRNEGYSLQLATLKAKITQLNTLYDEMAKRVRAIADYYRPKMDSCMHDYLRLQKSN